MRFMVEYIPLKKIKLDEPVKLTDRLKKLRSLMWECMHVIVVKKDQKDNRFIIVSGRDRYEYLRKQTKHQYAPCIIDESNTSSGMKYWITRLWNRNLPPDIPSIHSGPFHPTSLSIIRSFIKKEPRFVQLSRSQQFKVLILGIRYKKTVESSMREKVDEILSK
ncbi:hypothetical protein WD019_12055 [Fictibacillus sp. Mic-4]|uniref:hypothetical protein n=1 Tax=Fictibacillus sp. Mic-4 TaxID=3132826 RepID=UPI003CE9265C